MASNKARQESLNRGVAERIKIRVEFAVNINNQDDLDKIDEALRRKGVSLVSSDLKEKIIQLELPSRDNGDNFSGHMMENAHSLQRFIEEQTGHLAVVKGLGELSSAVCELKPPPEAELKSRDRVMGVVRMSQLEDSQCYIDGSIDGLSKMSTAGNHYSLAIHEYGDLAGDKYEHIGRRVIDIERTETSNTTSSLQSVSDRFGLINRIIADCDVASMIGRSIALTRFTSEGGSEERQVLTAGVIARASTIGANKKQICSCSGKTLWEERIDKKQTTTG